MLFSLPIPILPCPSASAPSVLLHPERKPLLRQGTSPSYLSTNRLDSGLHGRRALLRFPGSIQALDRCRAIVRSLPKWNGQGSFVHDNCAFI
ncbi:hypothetical protein TMatcc_005262 [Talaromyces marneffei ATCC 18224]